MKADPRFADLPKSFWASVKTLSQCVGYAKEGRILTPSIGRLCEAFDDLQLDSSALFRNGAATDLGGRLEAYFRYRSEVLHEVAEPNLMDAARAKREFAALRARNSNNCPMPMNKQSGEMKDHNFLTGLVNMTIEDNIGGLRCDFDPRELTTITAGGAPVRTLSRRVDGAFPGPVNPIAIWEIKEYYYTTTFGSRIADGVYESLLDGLELEELRHSESVEVEHYLMVDAYDTWWKMGKSYLCRMVDMVNMGYVDEVLFGAEVITELPRICAGWVAKYNASLVTP